MKLADLLRTARKVKGWSMRELEQKSGVSNPVISQIENGQVENPGFFTVMALARALNVSTGELKNVSQEKAAE